MRAVDTNVLVRLIVRDDERQTAAAEAAIANGAWVPQLALAEATWLLASVYQRSPAAIATAVEMLLNHRQLTLQDEETIATAVERLREHPSVGFSDCLMIEVALKSGHVPLVTFDRDLGKLPGAHRLRA